jgi:hypothetical protein
MRETMRTADYTPPILCVSIGRIAAASERVPEPVTHRLKH